jgi:hypothetical protein
MDGRVVATSLDRTISETAQPIGRFDKQSAVAISSYVRLAKAQRELIDYRAPSSAELQPMHHFEQYCKLPGELAK